MDTVLKYNEYLELALDAIVTEDQSVSIPDIYLQTLYQQIMESKDTLFLLHIVLLTH